MADTESREKDWEQEVQSEDNDVDNVEVADWEEETDIEDTDELAEDIEDEDCLDEEAEASSEEDVEAESEKKGFFKKREKKNKQEEKIAELTDCLKRQLAEFDNFRKRTEREKAQMFEVGAKSVIEKMLPVVDNFERGLSAVPEDTKEDPFVQGMDKIYKQFITELENLEVKPIEAVGTEFNPDFHNAVMQVESEEYESGVVAQELQKGYMYRDSVVRHSMVAVVQ
ncbi:MAG: nucleotide exchange factor GrpE [Lachnospiraceae bacterium]|nr:nucleotide exchange factor GrpE [Lachnospiraceae bacterium]